MRDQLREILLELVKFHLPSYGAYSETVIDQAIAKIEALHNCGKCIEYHAQRCKSLEAELAEAREEIKKSHFSITFTAKERDRYQTALRKIWQEAGKPTMSYAPNVELKERGKIIDKIVGIAKKALNEGDEK